MVHFSADHFLITFNIHSMKLKVKRSHRNVCLLYFMPEQVT